MTTDPFLAPDSRARALARRLIDTARHASLGTLDPDSGAPLVTRIALQADPDGAPVALLSGLAAHARALALDPRAGLMVAGDGSGDPMAQPRLSVLARAVVAAPDPARRDRWLARDPRAQLYIDLPDFRFWRLEPQSGLLNAGFGRAYRLAAADMLKPPAAEEADEGDDSPAGPSP